MRKVTRLKVNLTRFRESLLRAYTHIRNLQDQLAACKMQRGSLSERYIEAQEQRDALMAFLQEQQAELAKSKDENEKLKQDRNAPVILMTPDTLLGTGPGSGSDSEAEREAWRKARKLQERHVVERKLRNLGLG